MMLTEAYFWVLFQACSTELAFINPISLRSPLVVSSILCLVSQVASCPYGFTTGKLYVFLVSPQRVT
jgi:transcription elongation factor GreA-like protein